MQNETEFLRMLISLSGFLMRRQVRYMVVGGAAVTGHGFYRPTTDRDGNIADKPDFDFWFQPTYLNYKKLLDALDDMGLDVARYKEEQFPFPKNSFFRFKPQDYSLDFLPRVNGLNFGDCYQRRMISLIDGIEVSVISFDDLIIAKKFAGRPKDLEDIKQLELLRSQNK